jgi:hypothetical protein
MRYTLFGEKKGGYFFEQGYTGETPKLVPLRFELRRTVTTNEPSQANTVQVGPRIEREIKYCRVIAWIAEDQE